jgi:hypothetical protein
MTEKRHNRRAVVVEDITVHAHESDVIANPHHVEEALRILARLLVRRAERKGEIPSGIQLEGSSTVRSMAQRNEAAKTTRMEDLN